MTLLDGARPRTASAPTCSALRRQLGVDTAGSASKIRSWLLLEHPGAWGEDARDDAFAARCPRAGTTCCSTCGRRSTCARWWCGGPAARDAGPWPSPRC